MKEGRKERRVVSIPPVEVDSCAIFSFVLHIRDGKANLLNFSFFFLPVNMGDSSPHIIQIIEVAKRGNEEQLAELISSGHDVKVVDAVGNTPLHWAASGGHLEACKILVKHGVDLNATNKNGDTALHKAAWRGHAATIEFLLSSGINRDHKNHDNKAAIDLAKTKDVRKVLVPPVECKCHTSACLPTTFMYYVVNTPPQLVEEYDVDSEDED